MATSFRGDIEGLRALAILPILVFHLSPEWCPGGFVGVDFFFVISGYLITKMIMAEGGNFRFGAFYFRRFFRLFPALLATLIITVIAGWWILNPADYMSLAKSALAASVGVSNIYFYETVDYFNATSISHILLHTWSLAVEEQFYLVWPALLILCLRTRLPVEYAIPAIGLASFVALLLVQPVAAEFAFYMMPFRIFEFAVGAGIIALDRTWERMSPLLHGLMSMLGLGLLAVSLIALDSRTPWPGPATLIPVASAALLILSGRRGGLQALLQAAPLRFLGRISYSLYLIHWPLITLYRYFTIVEPNTPVLLALAAASILMATALHYAVEVPFRLHRTELRPDQSPDAPAAMRPMMKIRVAGAVTLAIATGLLDASVIAANGFPSRIDNMQVRILDKGLTFAGDLCSYRRRRCQFGDAKSTRTVYVVGDSHALNLIFGLDKLFAENGIKGIAFYDHGCLFAKGTMTFQNGIHDRPCTRNVDNAFEYLASRTDPVILTSDYAGYRGLAANENAASPFGGNENEYFDWLGRRLSESVERLGPEKRTVILLKQTYTTGIDLAKCLTKPSAAGTSECSPMKRDDAIAMYRNADEMIDRVAAKTRGQVHVLDPKRIFCTENDCVTQDETGLYFRDTNHLTYAGSRFLIEKSRDALLRAISR